jgi:phosphoglycolate phosphatase-like HAD superfamily hydrolase
MGIHLNILYLIKNLDPRNVMMVGDGVHDMLAGNAAGTVTCLLKNKWNSDSVKHADFVVDKLGEIQGIIDEHSLNIAE